MKKSLQKLMQQNKTVSIHEDEYNYSKVSVGRIVKIDDEFTLIKLISPDGLFGGYSAIQTSDIVSVDHDGDYENKINFLKENRNKVFHEVDIDLITMDIIVELISNAIKQQEIVTIWLEDEDDSIIGYVQSYNDLDHENKFIELKVIDDYGNEAGTTSLRFDSIKRIDYSSKKNQILKYFYENHKSKEK